MFAQLTSTEATAKEWSYLRGSQTKGNLTFSFYEIRCVFFRDLWYEYYCWKSAISFISFISPVLLDIFLLHVVYIFQKNIIFIPAYSGESLCETVQHV